MPPWHWTVLLGESLVSNPPPGLTPPFRLRVTDPVNAEDVQPVLHLTATVMAGSEALTPTVVGWSLNSSVLTSGGGMWGVARLGLTAAAAPGCTATGPIVDPAPGVSRSSSDSNCKYVRLGRRDDCRVDCLIVANDCLSQY